MGTGNPYTPYCQSYICRDKEARKPVCYVLVSNGKHIFSKEMKPWWHQTEGNPMVEREIYWACGDCINECPFKKEFQYTNNYKVKGLMS